MYTRKEKYLGFNFLLVWSQTRTHASERIMGNYLVTFVFNMQVLKPLFFTKVLLSSYSFQFVEIILEEILKKCIVLYVYYQERSSNNPSKINSAIILPSSFLKALKFRFLSFNHHCLVKTVLISEWSLNPKPRSVERISRKVSDVLVPLVSSVPKLISLPRLLVQSRRMFWRLLAFPAMSSIDNLIEVCQVNCVFWLKIFSGKPLAVVSCWIFRMRLKKF